MNTEINGLIGKSITGELSEQEKSDLNFWIKSSAENEKEFQTISEFMTQKEALPNQNSESDWNIIQSKMHSEKATGIGKSGKSIIPPYFLVAATFMLVIGFIFWYQSADNEKSDHFSGLNELFLEDGSQIILYGDGKLKIPSPFNRYAELTGSAYFIIQPDALHPFLIKTQNAVIKVIGTRFTVRSQEKYTHIVVTEGLVQLKGLTGDTTLQLIETGMSGSAADRSVFRPDLDQTISDIIQWENNRLVFRKIPLITLMKEISLQFDVSIEIKNPEVIGQTVSGIYEFQTEEGIIQSVCSALNLRYSKEGSVYSIY